MNFEPVMPDVLPNTYGARAGKFSFIVMRQDDGWYTSWQDQINGGSASNTREGPFALRSQAETRCRKIFQELQRKN